MPDLRERSRLQRSKFDTNDESTPSEVALTALVQSQSASPVNVNAVTS